MVLAAFAAFLAAHIAAYVAILRRLAFFRTEKGIFLYHFVFAVMACSVAFLTCFLDPVGFGLAGFVLVLSVHGIYSLSFLELWSLAQGGYSLSVIAEISRSEAAGIEPDFTALAQIGEDKQQDRILGLEKLGLITNRDGEIALTSRGRAIANALNGLLVWVVPNARL